MVTAGPGAVQDERRDPVQRSAAGQRISQLVAVHGGERTRGFRWPTQPTPASAAASAVSRRIEASGIGAQAGRLRVS